MCKTTLRVKIVFLVAVALFMIFAVPATQQPAHALAGTVIVGAVLATMAAAGITFLVSGLTASDLSSYISNKLDQWAVARGSTVDQLIQTSLIGVTISGLLMIGTQAAQSINDFISWLKSDMSLSDNETVVISSSDPSLSGMPYKYGSTFVAVYSGNQNITFTATNDLYCTVQKDYPSNGNYTFWFYIPKSHGPSYIVVRTQNGNNPLNIPVNMDFGSFYGVNTSIGVPPTDGTPIVNYNVKEYLIGLGSDYEFENGGTLAVGAGTITIPQVQNEEKLWLDVGAYPGSTVTEVTQDVLDDAVANELTVSGEVAAEEPEYILEGPVPVYGLTDVFPFCIPFDLYDFLDCLAADPVAPHFEWRLYVEDLVDYTFVIDLQAFETAAQILRTMELMLFIIGLAMVTRHLLRS